MDPHPAPFVVPDLRRPIASHSVTVRKQLACAATTLPTSKGAAYGKRAPLDHRDPGTQRTKPMVSPVFVTL
jgi:hypothetical protein